MILRGGPSLILLDENVPLEVLSELKKLNLQVDHVIKRDLRSKSDAVVVQTLKPDDLFVTFDRDFLERRAKTEAPMLVISNPRIVDPRREWSRWIGGIRKWVETIEKPGPQTPRPPVGPRHEHDALTPAILLTKYLGT